MNSSLDIMEMGLYLIGGVLIVYIIVLAFLQLKIDIKAKDKNVWIKRIGLAILLFIVRAALGMEVDNFGIVLINIVTCTIEILAFVYLVNKLRKEQDKNI